jgi:hypothetical protein
MKPTLLATASQRNGIIVLTKALTMTSSAATPADSRASPTKGSEPTAPIQCAYRSSMYSITLASWSVAEYPR